MFFFCLFFCLFVVVLFCCCFLLLLFFVVVVCFLILVSCCCFLFCFCSLQFNQVNQIVRNSEKEMFVACVLSNGCTIHLHGQSDPKSQDFWRSFTMASLVWTWLMVIVKKYKHTCVEMGGGAERVCFHEKIFVRVIS